MDTVEHFGDELGRRASAHASAANALSEALADHDLYLPVLGSKQRARDKRVQIVCERCGQPLPLPPPWSGEGEVASVGTYRQIQVGRGPLPPSPPPAGSPLGDALRRAGEVGPRKGRDGVFRDVYLKREPQAGRQVFFDVFDCRLRWWWFHRCTGGRKALAREIVRDADGLEREVERRRVAGEDPARIRV